MKNIYVLPTDKPSRFFITNEDEYGFREHYAPDTMQTIKCMNIHITSDEEIKEGDWFIHPDSSCFDKECKEVSIGGYEILRVIKVDENFIYHSAMMAIHKNKNIKKIILTTDQGLIKNGVQAIENDFLEWFVKNPSCEWVDVKRNYLGSKCLKCGFIENHDEVDTEDCPKCHNTTYEHLYNNKIIIPKE